MTEFCIICETEPITLLGWAQIKGGKLDTEYVCPWCIDDMHENKDRKRIEKLTAALSIYEGDMFSRVWIKEMIK